MASFFCSQLSSNKSKLFDGKCLLLANMMTIHVSVLLNFGDHFISYCCSWSAAMRTSFPPEFPK